MAKSIIIKELANSSIDTATALKRLKILLLSLKKPKLDNWVNCELNGYKEIANVPDYRRFRGQVTANFIIGNAYRMITYNNTPLPTTNLSKEIRDRIEEITFSEGITAIKEMEGQELGKSLPPEIYGVLTKGTNIDSITSASVRVSKIAPVEIISAVETKVLEILCVLEKEFGILDELDLDCSDKSEKAIDDISQRILNIIYVDKSITIGDDNKITKSDFYIE